MYTDNTLLTWGPHKFTKLCRVPAEYLIELSKKQIHDKELRNYIKNNMEKIIARKDGKLTEPKLELDFKFTKNGILLICPETNKTIFPSEKEAKKELRRISFIEQKQKKPQRSYECKTCGGWHLTSMSLEEWKAKE